MQHTDITADHASTLGVLVNTDRIRSSIKRLFHNRIDEVVSEIVQNCQRDLATNVDIVTTENSFTIQITDMACSAGRRIPHPPQARRIQLR